MRFRKLRIAWSLVWGVVAVLLCVFWIRGCWRTDSIKIRKPPIGCSFWSGRGALAVSFSNHIPRNDSDRLRYESYPVGRDHSQRLGFDYQPGTPTSWTLFIPDWFSIGVFGALATMPWLPIKRFSLRTFLIVTTLVAAMLGAIIVAAR